MALYDDHVKIPVVEERDSDDDGDGPTPMEKFKYDVDETDANAPMQQVEEGPPPAAYEVENLQRDMQLEEILEAAAEESKDGEHPEATRRCDADRTGIWAGVLP